MRPGEHAGCVAARRGLRLRRFARRRPQRGVTYLMLLTFLAVMMAGLGVVGPLWSRQAQRDREADLLRIGAMYAQAVQSYRDLPVAGVKQYPASIDALLSDDRTRIPTRHLRRAYPDPMEPGRPWTLIHGADGLLRGVASGSQAVPFRRTPIETDLVKLTAARTYADWKFVPEEASP